MPLTENLRSAPNAPDPHRRAAALFNQALHRMAAQPRSSAIRESRRAAIGELVVRHEARTLRYAAEDHLQRRVGVHSFGLCG